MSYTLEAPTESSLWTPARLIKRLHLRFAIPPSSALSKQFLGVLGETARTSRAGRLLANESSQPYHRQPGAQGCNPTRHLFASAAIVAFFANLGCITVLLFRTMATPDR